MFCLFPEGSQLHYSFPSPRRSISERVEGICDRNLDVEFRIVAWPSRDSSVANLSFEPASREIRFLEPKPLMAPRGIGCNESVDEFRLAPKFKFHLNSARQGFRLPFRDIRFPALQLIAPASAGRPSKVKWHTNDVTLQLRMQT